MVSSVIGVFLIRAARRYDPSEAAGLGEALAALASRPFGPWGLAIVAAGLTAYGIYLMVKARYRGIQTT